MKLTTLFLLALIYSTVSAQSDTSQIFYIDDFRIKAVREVSQNGSSKLKTKTYKDLYSVKITNDTFAFRSGENSEVIKFTGREIKTISIKDGNYLLPAAGYSALGGFAAGFLLGTISHGKGSGHPSYSLEGPEFGLALGALIGLTCGVVGGIFGAITPYYEEFDLNKNGPDNNGDELKKIIKSHSK